VRRSAGFLVAFSIVVLACGGAAPADQGGSSSAPDGGNPTTSAPAGAIGTPGTSLTSCEMITPADIEAALQLDPGTVDEGQTSPLAEGDDPAANSCKWSGDWGSFSIIVNPTLGASYFADATESLAERAEVISVGDGGLWVADIERGYFLKGSVMILAQFLRITGDASPRDAVIALGTDAVNRI